MKPKVTRRRNWYFEGMVVLLLLSFVFVWWLITREIRLSVFGGCITYFLFAWPLRLTLQREHRLGMAALRAGDHMRAVMYFQRSYDFFDRHRRVDQYRFITMFSSSLYSYREMALWNTGVAFLRMEKPADAADAFRRLISVNPGYAQAREMLARIEEFLK